MRSLAGHSFQSGAERRRAEELVEMEEVGDITGLEFQKVVWLTRASVQYTADFFYHEEERDIDIYEEVKGKECYPWYTIRKLWRVYGPTVLIVLKVGSRGQLRIAEQIWPTG